MFNLSYCTAVQGSPGQKGLPGYPGEEGGPVSSSIYIYHFLLTFMRQKRELEYFPMPFELLMFVSIK